VNSFARRFAPRIDILPAGSSCAETLDGPRAGPETWLASWPFLSLTWTLTATATTFRGHAFVGSSRWYPLSVQRLDSCRCAIDFFAFAAILAEATPRGYGHVADQLRRASLSVPLRRTASAQGHR